MADEKTPKPQKNPRNHQKFRLLYMKKIFEEYSDADHPLTMEDINRHLAAFDTRADRRSIYNDVADLQAEPFNMDIEHEERSTEYRLASHTFDIFELKMMIDSIQASKFLTEKQSSQMVKKLEGLCSVYERGSLNRQVIVSERVKAMNQKVHYALNNIHAAINDNRKIRFKYFEYNYDKSKYYRNQGKFFTVSPWQLVYTDDNYYLLAYSDYSKDIRNYRVDRMDSIIIMNDYRDGKDAFAALDMSAYTQYTFSMFNGKRQVVEMIFYNRMMNAVIDRFGRDVVATKVDDEHFKIAVSVAVSPQFYAWIFGLGNKVEIVGPKEVREEYREMLKKQFDLYKD